MTFRLERSDRSGNRLRPVPVEMRGTIIGVVNEGDRVEAHGSWKEGLLFAQRVYNTTTDSVVKKKSYKLQIRIAIVIFIVWMLIMFVGIGVLSGELGKFLHSIAPVIEHPVQLQFVYI